MCKNELVEEKYKQLDEFIDRIEDKHESLITILYKAQELFGYLPKEVQLHVSRKINMPAAKVYGVVTFYSYFQENPRGEHIINVCMGTACFVKGSQSILDELQNILKIKAGETTPDGKFTIDTLRCVGACGLAPVIIIDGKVYGRVKNSEVKKIISEYK